MAIKRKRCDGCAQLFDRLLLQGARTFRDDTGNIVPGFSYACATCRAPHTAYAAKEEARYALQRAQYEREQAEREEREQAELAKERQRASFLEGVKSAAPKGDDDEGASVHLWRTVQGAGALPENPFDRFTTYASVTELLDQAQKPNPNTLPVALSVSPFEHASIMQRSPVYPSWEGFEDVLSFAQVRAFIEQGWPQGAETLARDMEQLDAPSTGDIRRRGTWDDNGDEISVDRALAGNYEQAWRVSKRKQVLTFSRVRIVVDLGTSCGACDNIVCTVEPVQPEALFWRGAAAASLSQSLTEAGYACEIVAGVALRRLNSYRQEREYCCMERPEDQLDVKAGRANTLALSVIAKDFDEDMEPSRLAAITCNAAFMRRIMLAEIASQVTYRTDFGTLDSLENPRVKEELGLETPGCVTVYVPDWSLSKVMANAWVRGTLYGLEHHKTGMTLDDSAELTEEFD